LQSSFYLRFGKRFFDFFASCVGLILLLPILIIVAVGIKLTSKGPIFFAQIRVGKNFKPFKIYKFRTMRLDNIGPSVTKGDDPRITKLGRVLRKSKIDELPQLLNVIKGDMSLVGPRPEVEKFVTTQKDAYAKILSIRPGITDNAAIVYRDEEKIMETFEDTEKAYVEKILPLKIELYKDYLDTISFKTDIKLILQTLKVI